MESTNFENAVDDVLHIFMFEQWMRFYFIQEEGDKLFLRIPEERMEAIGETLPHLKPLAESMNNEELTPEISQKHVCSFVGSRLDGTRYTLGLVPTVLDSKDFKIGLYVFNLWLEGHESVLDEQFTDFLGWEEMFNNWKLTDEVQKYLKDLQSVRPTSPGSHCVH